MTETYIKMAKDIFANLGTGHTEFIYHRAMEIELQLAKIVFETEKRVLITYEKSDKKFTLGEERIDLFIPDDGLIIELKAITGSLGESEIAQLRKYQRELSKMGIAAKSGLVINFPQPNKKECKHEVEIISTKFREI